MLIGSRRGDASRPACYDRDVVAKERRLKKRRLIVPIVLAVGAIAGATSVITSQIGCGGDDGPTADAGVGDGQPDTPVI
jgi:hypothetical protein